MVREFFSSHLLLLVSGEASKMLAVRRTDFNEKDQAKLRTSPRLLHGVFHKSRVFDPTCLFEAKAKPMIQQKCSFDSYIANYADVENLLKTLIIKDVSSG